MFQSKVLEWLTGSELCTCCLQETHITSKDTDKLRVREWKKVFYANGKKKKAEVATLASDKMNFKTKTVKRDKVRHDIMIKWINPTKK